MPTLLMKLKGTDEMGTAPVVDLNSIDVVGVRNDGGLDLGVSCQGPLDSNPETLCALRAKIKNYVLEIVEAGEPTLIERFGCAVDANIRILIFCPYRIYPEADAVIRDLIEECLGMGIDVIVDQTPRA